MPTHKKDVRPKTLMTHAWIRHICVGYVSQKMILT